MSQPLTQIVSQRTISEVIQVRNLTKSTYVIRFERNNMAFRPGQYIVVNPEGMKQKREYSIYSSVNEPFLELLIKEVDAGLLSRKLKQTQKGNLLELEGPFGYFVINEDQIPNKKFLFIATGTGISPFHSIVNSYPQLNYTILHGVRTWEEGYEKEQYLPGKYIQCTSKDQKGDFHGRVTDYLKLHPVDTDTVVYLCGNSAMIDEAYTILESQHLSSFQIHTEVYF